jgi:sigma-E factor negative regulatory protein RseC
LREKALVVENKGNDAKVEILRSSACDHCRACSVGTEKKPLFVWAKNPLKARVGQLVEVEMQASTMLLATLIVYVIPLVAFIAGIGLGYSGAGFFHIKSTELFSLLIGLIFMGLSFLGIHFYSQNAEKSKKYFSNIVNILEQ